MKRLNRILLFAVTISCINLWIIDPAQASELPFPSIENSDYNKPWAKLPLPSNRISASSNIKNITISGDADLKRFYNLKNVIIKNQTYHLRFEEQAEKFQTTFIHIKNCNNVIIENLKIIQLDPDYRAYHSVLIEDCDNVTVKNSLFSGTCNFHLRSEGCKNIFLDGIVVKGYDYGELGIRCGGGIWINNGNPTSKNRSGLWSPNPKDLKSLIIQNCFIHDNLSEDKSRNNDGILIHSAGNGFLFNNRFERWLKGDSALDISHRRSDDSYKEKTFIVERNFFFNNKHVKSVGTSDVSNSIIWRNNIYIDTRLGNYHQNWRDLRVCETFIFTKKDFGFWRNWGRLRGPVVIEQCLFFLKQGQISSMFKLDNINGMGAMAFLHLNKNVYYMPKKPGSWLVSEKKDGSHAFAIRGWREWQQRGFDHQSIFTQNLKDFTWRQKDGINYIVWDSSNDRHDLCVSPSGELHHPTSELEKTAEKETVFDLKVESPQKDFFGLPRNDCCIGAVCK